MGMPHLMTSASYVLYYQGMKATSNGVKMVIQCAYCIFTRVSLIDELAQIDTILASSEAYG